MSFFRAGFPFSITRLVLGFAAAFVVGSLFGQAQPAAPISSPPGLLFYLSAEKGTTADVAAPGTAEPTFVAEVDPITDGARGAALACGDYQRLAWRAPGNLYAQRGTLSFFWRSRYEVGPTEFPIFRVAFADHSSWDMTWLRIDYNGHGFDAFVTDANLARVRVSIPVQSFPAPKTWTHLAITWDETEGIRFYVNGKFAAANKTVAVLDTGLDQFGPHSRIISPHQVQSDYNFTRGGDIDEIRTYDRALSAENIATLARGDAPTGLAPVPARSLADAATRREWLQRYGFNRPKDLPPALPAGSTVAIRKVEIHEAYDIKRWWWKANDGIRETTWPGVYNRSRLTGRNDYFQLPDWDCYVDSGKAVTFALPEEPWNHLEISGAAAGIMELLPPRTEMETAYAVPPESLLFERPRGQEKTVHTLARSFTGRKIRFTNFQQETPIGELAAYNVTAGTEPAGSTKLAFHLVANATETKGDDIDARVASLQTFIAERFAPDERATLLAQPADAALPATPANFPSALPLVHVLIPNTWDKLTAGLDGIAIDLPALRGSEGNNRELLPLNIQVKDPLWPGRNLLDFTFSVKPGEKKTLWLDLRDRLLPAGKSFWLTVAAADADFNLIALHGAEVRLVFKPREAARAEHELDRFTQARDSYAMLVEEHPNSPKLALWVRFKGDLEDLLRVNPDHVLGRQYAAAAIAGSPRPAFTQPEAPPGVPLWAFRQSYLLGQMKHFVEYYIDHRQSDYGDFGGGISDDVDLTNTWPGMALMGAEPEKLKVSVHRLLEAAFKNGMFTNGLSTIQADELHSYEEGINCLAQNLILDYGNPTQLERAMVTARGVEGITGINAAGHRHIRSSYFSGSKMAEDGPWGWSKPYGYLVCQVPELLVDYNGNPAAKKYLLELTDGFLAHRRVGENGRGILPTAIHFSDDREGDYGRGYFPWHMFWGPWKWTHEQRYLDAILDTNSTMSVNANVLDLLNLRQDWTSRNAAPEGGRRDSSKAGEFRPGNRAAGFRNSSNEHFAWQVDGDKSHLERLYAQQIENCAVNEYIETEGSLWIDRVGIPFTEIQRARLGGVALARNALYPGHVVSWKFAAPATGQSVAILVPSATPTSFKVIAYNLDSSPVRATMTGWNIDPGSWEITQGLDLDNDDIADQSTTTREEKFERSSSLEFTLPARAQTVLTFTLKKPGTPYWQRPDLGIAAEDVVARGRELHVTVHSLGSVASTANRLVFRDQTGRIVAEAPIPALAPPNDLHPKTAEVILKLPRGIKTAAGAVEIDPAGASEEITRANNIVRL
jgi:hypothetical protein